MYTSWIFTIAAAITFAQSLIIEYEGTSNIFHSKFVYVDLKFLNNTDANYTYNGYKVSYTNGIFLLVGLDKDTMPSNDKREIANEAREEWSNVIQLGPSFIKSLSNTSVSDLISRVSKRDDEVTVTGLHITKRFVSTGLDIGSYSNIVKRFTSAVSALATILKEAKECEIYTTKYGATWFQIHTCATGGHCDITVSERIVKEAETHALHYAQRHKAYSGSYTMNHGTWQSCVEYYRNNDHANSFPGCPAQWCKS